MITGKLFVLGAAAFLACSPALAQERPSYDEALQTVTEDECERTEAEDYVRYFCRESDALWYFTIEGRPEHAAYFKGFAYARATDPHILPPGQNRETLTTGHGSLEPRAKSREEADARRAAMNKWNRMIISVWQADSARLKPEPRRDHGRLYPAV